MQEHKLNRYHEVLELNEHERNHTLHLLCKVRCVVNKYGNPNNHDVQVTLIFAAIIAPRITSATFCQLSYQDQGGHHCHQLQQKLETSTLPCSCLFLDWHDLHNFINHFFFHEMINNLILLDWNTEKVNFFEGFNFSSFN